MSAGFEAAKALAAALGPPPPAATPPAEFRSPAEGEYGALEADAEKLLLRGALLPRELLSNELQAFDDFLERGLESTAADEYRIRKPVLEPLPDEGTRQVDICIDFRNVRVSRPQAPHAAMGQVEPLFPSQARRQGLSYTGMVSMEATVRLVAYAEGGEERAVEADVPRFAVMGLPIMKGSAGCNTAGMTAEELRAVGEDPADPGGYMVVHGGEYKIPQVENIAFNVPQVWPAAPGEAQRCEIISQPMAGVYGNSSQIRVERRPTGEIVVQITSQRFKTSPGFPLATLPRLYGYTDAQLAAAVVPEGPADARARLLRERVAAALLAEPAAAEMARFRAEVDRGAILEGILEVLAAHGDTLAAPSDRAPDTPELRRRRAARLEADLDRFFLPHLGTEAGAEARSAKVRFLAAMVRQLLLVGLGYLAPTDRDSAAVKRLHGGAYSLSKLTKTGLGAGFVDPVLAHLTRAVRSRPFAEFAARPADLRAPFEAHARSAALSRLTAALVAPILSPSTGFSLNGRSVPVRMRPVALERKNPLNVADVGRLTVKLDSGKSKSSARTIAMRQLHATNLGTICTARSPESGEDVGKKGNLACTTVVSLHTEEYTLRRAVAADIAAEAAAAAAAGRAPLLVAAATAPPFVAADGGAAEPGAAWPRVLVNGTWLASAADTLGLARRYRELRRAGALHPQTTVAWDPLSGDLTFSTDVGRALVPLLIVRNNREDPATAWDTALPGDDGADFVQGCAAGGDVVRAAYQGRLSVDDLVAAGVAEFVGAGETANTLVAPSLAALAAARHDARVPYTHVMVPAQVYGLAALAIQHPSHTQQARVATGLLHARQSASWPTLPIAPLGNRSYQHAIEVPLVASMLDSIPAMRPFGANMVVAVFPDGTNQEDSGTLSALTAATSYRITFVRVERVEVAPAERVGVPPPGAARSRGAVSYAKLGPDGVVPVGTWVARGDVVVGRVAFAGGGAAEDRSVVYRHDEDAYVAEVIHSTDSAGLRVVGVVFHSELPLGLGSKFSTLNGNKAVVGAVPRAEDVFVLADGTPVDFYTNPHSYPTRMTIGQFAAARQGLACAARGRLGDAAAFAPYDAAEVGRELVALGFRPSGRATVFSRTSGEPLAASIFVGLATMMRIQKFAEHESRTCGANPTRNGTTHQPLKARDGGGRRIPEMEMQVLAAQGAATRINALISLSDRETQYVCARCGADAVANPRAALFRCPLCGVAGDVVAVDGSRTALVVRQMIQGAGVDVRQVVAPPALPVPWEGGPL